MLFVSCISLTKLDGKCMHFCDVSDSCCSLTYDKESLTCEIYPLEHQAEGVSLVEKPYTDYYKRQRCEGGH